MKISKQQESDDEDIPAVKKNIDPVDAEEQEANEKFFNRKQGNRAKEMPPSSSDEEDEAESKPVEKPKVVEKPKEVPVVKAEKPKKAPKKEESDDDDIPAQKPVSKKGGAQKEPKGDSGSSAPTSA